MKKTKNDWRSNLCDKTLSDLILIELESPSIKNFDPDRAIALWNCSASAGRSRRPCTEPHKKQDNMQDSATTRSIHVDDDQQEVEEISTDTESDDIVSDDGTETETESDED